MRIQRCRRRPPRSSTKGEHGGRVICSMGTLSSFEVGPRSHARACSSGVSGWGPSGLVAAGLRAGRVFMWAQDQCASVPMWC
eukprot:7321168-Pyramimonas_sp.AAC.1